MAKRRSKGGREARKATEAGIGLIGFGLMLLVLPVILGHSPLSPALLHLWGVAGWMLAGGAGLQLLACGMVRVTSTRGLCSCLRGRHHIRARANR